MDPRPGRPSAPCDAECAFLREYEARYPHFYAPYGGVVVGDLLISACSEHLAESFSNRDLEPPPADPPTLPDLVLPVKEFSDSLHDYVFSTPYPDPDVVSSRLRLVQLADLFSAMSERQWRNCRLVSTFVTLGVLLEIALVHRFQDPAWCQVVFHVVKAVVYGAMPSLEFHLSVLYGHFEVGQRGGLVDGVEAQPCVGGRYHMEPLLRYRLFYPPYRVQRGLSLLQQYFALLRVANLSLEFLLCRTHDPTRPMRSLLYPDQGSKDLYDLVHQDGLPSAHSGEDPGDFLHDEFPEVDEGVWDQARAQHNAHVADEYMGLFSYLMMKGDAPALTSLREYRQCIELQHQTGESPRRPVELGFPVDSDLWCPGSFPLVLSSHTNASSCSSVLRVYNCYTGMQAPHERGPYPADRRPAGRGSGNAGAGDLPLIRPEDLGRVVGVVSHLLPSSVQLPSNFDRGAPGPADPLASYLGGTPGPSSRGARVLLAAHTLSHRRLFAGLFQCSPSLFYVFRRSVVIEGLSRAISLVDLRWMASRPLLDLVDEYVAPSSPVPCPFVGLVVSDTKALVVPFPVCREHLEELLEASGVERVEGRGGPPDYGVFPSDCGGLVWALPCSGGGGGAPS